MPGFGLRLQLEPPPNLYPGLPRIQAATEVTPPLPATAFYVGKGSAKLKLPRSTLAPPYSDHVDGTPEYCVRLCAKTAETDAEHQQLVKQVATSVPTIDTLVVDVQPGHPSHAEVLAYLIWTARGGTLPKPASEKPAQAPAQGGAGQAPRAGTKR